MLSVEFTKRVNNCTDLEFLEEEIKTMFFIMLRNHHDFKISLEMIEKILFVTKRIKEIKQSP